MRYESAGTVALGDLLAVDANLKILAGTSLNHTTGDVFATTGTTLVPRQFRGSLTYVGGTSVPEPGTLALFCIGLAGLGFARRRKAA